MKLFSKMFAGFGAVLLTATAVAIPVMSVPTAPTSIAASLLGSKSQVQSLRTYQARVAK
jgi:hypothetical protein